MLSQGCSQHQKMVQLRSERVIAAVQFTHLHTGINAFDPHHNERMQGAKTTGPDIHMPYFLIHLETQHHGN